MIGKKVVEVKLMSDAEVDDFGWHQSTMVLVFDDGTEVFAASDEEGNGPGCLFGVEPDGSEFYVTKEKT